MKNKPYPALLGGSYLFDEIKKRTPKSRETIPLNGVKQRKIVHRVCSSQDIVTIFTCTKTVYVP
jgi:hypothetical protein